MIFRKVIMLAVTFGLITLLLSCNSTKKANTLDNNTTEITEQNIIVQVQGSATAEQIEKEFEEYGLKLVKPISKITNLFLFSYNTQTVKQNNILEILKSSESIQEAEFDKILDNRSDK